MLISNKNMTLYNLRLINEETHAEGSCACTHGLDILWLLQAAHEVAEGHHSLRSLPHCKAATMTEVNNIQKKYLL